MESDLFCVCNHPTCPRCEARHELVRARDARLQSAAEQLTPQERREVIRQLNGGGDES